MAPFRFQRLQLLSDNGESFLLGEQFVQDFGLPVDPFEKFGTIRLGGAPGCERLRIGFVVLLTLDKTLLVV